MTFNELSKKLKASVQTVPNLINVLADAFADMEGGSSGYSTEEHVVGKWIDGTTDVYEKSYELNNITFSNSALVIDNTLNKDNCILIDIYGTIYTSSGVGTSLCGISGINEFSIGPYIGNDIEIYAGNAAAETHYANGKLVCTVRYMKKTA